VKRGNIVEIFNGKLYARVLYNGFDNKLSKDKIVPINMDNISENSIKFDTLYFKYDIANKISNKEKEKLKKLKFFLEDNVDMLKYIIINGYTCNIGKRNYNLALSIKRAQFIAKNIYNKNLKMLAYGFGESKPAYPNSNKFNQSKNRRVEIYLVVKNKNNLS
jgi:outer membrane protein OmpA-like peptidoglycan-associated protein